MKVSPMRTALVLVVLVGAACGSTSPSEEQPPETAEVSLRLNWQWKGEFTPWIVAVENGYFAERGLEVTVNEGESATQAMLVVAQGQDDFAYVPSIQLIKGVNEGMPVKVVGTVVKVDPMGWVTHSDVPLETPSDIEGLRVEISPASTFHQIWEAFAEENDINTDQVEVVAADPGARFGLFLDRQVDVLADIFLTNEAPVLAARADGELNKLRVADWGFPLLGYVLVANEETMSDPDVVRRFVAAGIEAFQFTLDNPDEAAQIASDAYPDLLDPEITRAQVEALVDFLQAGTPEELFVGSKEGWDETLDILDDSGAITERNEAEDYFTNEFLPSS